MSKDGYRIIFMGTPDFAVPSLTHLLDSHHQVLAVVTQPDKKKGRGKKLAPPPVKEVAENANIPVLQPAKIKTEEFLNKLKSYNPDLIVVVAYGRILPTSILTLPPLGCINVHGSLLPKHRGAAPIQWAIIAGDSTAGVTIMQMDEGMDTGDILLPAAINVDEDETAGSLFAKLASLGAETLITALTMLQNDELTPQQQDHDDATLAPPLKKEMGLIDWSKSAEELQSLIRGLDPWPSAYTYLDGKRYRLFLPRVIHKNSDAPNGTVLLADSSGLLIATGSNALLVSELQPEGKKRLAVEAFLCGHPIAIGSRFSSRRPS
jgi:methionyl-tRNA formyltransferase